MNRTNPKNVARITHVLEMGVAACLLAALAVPALLFPSVQTSRDLNWFDSGADAEESSYVAEALAVGTRRPAPAPSVIKDAPKVSARFAYETLRRLNQRFEFSRRMVTALPEATDADVEELVNFALMGNADMSGPVTGELVYWDWLIHLEAVDLTNSQVSDAALLQLGRLPELQELIIPNTKVTDEGLAVVRQLANLESLTACNTAITDRGIQALVGCTKLTSLDLSNTSVSDEGVRQLAGLRNMTSLYLSNTRVTSDSLKIVANFPKMRELSLNGCSVDDAGIGCLADLALMETLDLCNTQITGAAVVNLLDMDRLVELSIEGTKIDPKGLAMLQAALPECEICP